MTIGGTIKEKIEVEIEVIHHKILYFWKNYPIN